MRIACLMALLAGLGLLAGCGEGSSDSTGSTSVSGDLSKSEWIARADEICQAEDEDEDVAAWNKKLDRLNESGLNDPEEVAEFAAILRKVLPKSEQGIRELRELEPPRGDSHAIEAVLEKDEETLGLIKEAAKEMEKVMSQRQNSFPSKQPCPIGPLSGWRSVMTSSFAVSKSSQQLPAEPITDLAGSRTATVRL